MWVSGAITVVWCALLWFLLRRSLAAALRDQSWSSLQPYWLLPALAVYTVGVWLRAVRWRVAIGSDACGMGLMTRITAQHIFWINVMPARSGELSFMMLLKKYGGLEYGRSGAALLVVRLCDVMVLGLYGMVGVASVVWRSDSPQLASPATWLGVFAATAVLALVILMAAPLLLQRYGMAAYTPQRATLISILWLTLAFFTLTFLNYGLLLAAAGWPLRPLQTLFAGSLVEGASALPIHGFLSLGSQEAVWVAGLSLLGASPAQAARAGLFVHASAVLMSLLLAAVSMVGMPRRD